MISFPKSFLVELHLKHNFVCARRRMLVNYADKYMLSVFLLWLLTVQCVGAIQF